MDTGLRSYALAYDGLSRLTAATYGEGSSLAQQPGRYSEALTYDPHGNPKSITRWGITEKLEGNVTKYGVIDYLTLNYSGNQVVAIKDTVPRLIFNGAADFLNGADDNQEYRYDANGNLVYDANKGVTNVAYNHLNLPLEVIFEDGHSLLYTYSSTGEKLKVASKTNDNVNITPLVTTDESSEEATLCKGSTTDYCGPYIYKDGRLHLLLTEGGYMAFDTLGNSRYYYYLTDHLGNNRVVLSQNGTEEQVNHYYPFGMEFNEKVYANTQPYKFGGKEEQPMHRLNLYDFHARQYDPMLGRFTSMDPLAEKYYSWSPYAYCNNNPIKYIDPLGMDIWEINDEGRIINRIKDKTQDAFYMVAKDADGNYQRTYTTDSEGNKQYNSVSFEYGTVESQRSISFSPDGKTTDTYDVYQVRGDANGSALFEFMSNNVTGSGSEVEFSHIKTGVAGDKGLNFLTTSHEAREESGAKYLINGQLNQGYFIREFNHSHPQSAYPSGLYTRKNDIGAAASITEISKYWKYTSPSFNIYHVPSRKMIPYSPKSQPHEFGFK